MMSTLIWMIPVGVAGFILHELMHALATWLVGGKVREVNLLAGYVDYEVSTAARERIVLLAPALAGLLLLPLLVWLLDGLSLLVALWGWLWLTLTGGAEGEINLLSVNKTARYGQRTDTNQSRSLDD